MTPYFAVFALSMSLLSLAQPARAEQKLLAAQSQIGFTSRQMGVPVEGKFRQFEAQITFNPQKVDASKISFNIDMASVSVGGPETEAEVIKPEWFHTAQFAQAKFDSTHVRTLGVGQFEVQGKLSIKGQTQQLSIPVSLTQAGPLTTATGSFSLKRLDFKLGDTDWKDTSIVANEVQVKFKLVLSGVPAI
jgi:polyisoprenoid-binding protein YceI